MDEDLSALLRIQGGDEEGLRELMTRYREPLFRFIYRYVLHESDATELTEETFVRVFQQAHRFRPKAKVKTWVFAIAANLCRDFLRKQKKHRFTGSLFEESGSGSLQPVDRVAAHEPHPHSEAITRERLQAIDVAIQELPEKLKFPFLFCVMEDHSYDDCAEILGTNRKTVETRIYRARQQLRDTLHAIR